jgi:hypothetical protein
MTVTRQVFNKLQVLVIFSIFLVLMQGSLFAQNNFKLIEFKAPAAAAPGMAINCMVKLEVLSDNQKFHRPGGRLIWGKGKHYEIPAAAFTPWSFGEKQKKGQIVSVKFTVQMPQDIPLGDKVKLIFFVFGKDKGKWIYANIVLKNNDVIIHKKHIITIKKAKKLKPLSHRKRSVPISSKIVVVPSIKSPVIDGTMEPGEWEKSAELGIFTNNATGNKVLPETVGFIGHDAKTIYLAFICKELAMAEIIAKKFALPHDAAIWENDALDIFFRPDLNSTDYVQFMSDTLNQHYDAISGDYYGYNPVWKSAVSKNGNDWVIEIAIPFSAISKDSVEAGTLWQADFFRHHNRGKKQSAWQATKGSCAMINKHGFIVFDSIKTALNRQALFADNYKLELGKLKSPELTALLAKLKTIKYNINHWNNEKIKTNFFKLQKQLKQLKKAYRQLVFKTKYASSNSALIIQQAAAFGTRPPEKNNNPLLEDLSATFLMNETRQFAFNVTNISTTPITFRCSFRYGKTPGIANKGWDYLRLGLQGFKTIWYTVTGVATADGTIVYDALPENPSATYFVVPGQTIQCFVSITPKNRVLAKSHGVLVIQSIDGNNMKPKVVAVNFNVIPIMLTLNSTNLFTFGWDLLNPKIVCERPEFAKAHFTTLNRHGFNVTQINGLIHLPRPKADNRGKLLDKMDFRNLDQLLNYTQAQSNYYYLGIAIWEKQQLRKDIFCRDFNSPAYEKAFKTWLKLTINHLLSKGIAKNKIIINGYDESINKNALMIYKWIKEVDPTLITLVDCLSADMNDVKRINPYVDIWMPHFRTLNDESFQEFYHFLLKTGKPIMSYYYSTGGNEKTKAPYGDYILKFWKCYSLNINGLGYWAAGSYYYGDPYYRKISPTSYDTLLLYPNENGVTVSRRLLAWQRGVEDFKLLKLTEAKLKKDNNVSALNKLQENARLVTKYPNDLNKAETMRQFCREILDN